MSVTLAEREKETTAPIPRHSGRSETETRNPRRGIGFPLSREDGVGGFDGRGNALIGIGYLQPRPLSFRA